MVIAHSKTAAAALSLLMQNQQMHKTYHVQVRGQFSAALKARGQVDLPIDGKPSCSQFHILTESTEPSRTWLEVTLITGRKHQIRRHFAAGHGRIGIGDDFHPQIDDVFELLAIAFL